MSHNYLLSLVFMFTSHSVFAKSWTIPSILSTSNETILKPGQTHLGIGALYGEYKERFSQSGSLERVSKVQKSRDGVKRSAGDYQYETNVSRSIFITQWEYGILSDWTVGLQLPVIESQFKKQYSNSGLNDTSRNTRLGNVEIVSKKSFVRTQKHNFVLAQRLDFPALIEDNQEEEIQRAQERLGYAIGLGMTLDSSWMPNWRTALNLMFDYTFVDRIRINDSDDKLIRNPGDELYIEASLGHLISPELDAQVATGLGYKFKDQYKSSSEMQEIEASSGVYQSIGELRLSYRLPRKTELASQHVAELKYHTTLAGKNVDDLDMLGIRWQIFY